MAILLNLVQSSSTSPVVLPVVPVQCRGSALSLRPSLYRSGNLLIIIPPQDSVLSSNNTNSSVLFSV